MLSRLSFMVRSHSLVVQWTLNPRGRGFKSHPNHMARNKIVVGAIWEAVEDEPQHFYEILSDGEIISLRRLCDNKRTTRFVGQITGYGVIRRKRRGE